ncbi:MAG: hypothetical protein JWQ35_960 [Bacteriovoracaceae bacterium]|nr:hypothetical protein [Bacteriovoracaceae bacterium]
MMRTKATEILIKSFLFASLPFVFTFGLHLNTALALPIIGKEKTAEDLIFENPVKQYNIFRARLKKYGANASFPEFKPVVNELQKQLASESFLAVVKQHPALGLELTEVTTQLFHVNLDFTFDDAANYPYDRPFPGPFPYRPTIDAIEDAIRLFDKVERLTNPKAVPLYHFDRYAYHRHSLLADPEIIVFPTLRNLTFENLIRVRSVPIGFVGVATKTLRVDRHWQSPLDFWYHDLNHVRRMVAYIALRAKIRGAKTIKEKLAFYKEMDDFIANEIIPNIHALPKGSSAEAVAVRRLVRVIIFEIVHETALTAERETILADLLRAPNTPQPFEHMMLKPASFTTESIEALRTATGNIQSGATTLGPKNAGDPLLIRYFHDRALSLLANVYNKLNYGFFDDPEQPNNFVAPVEARKADFVVQAAQAIFEFLHYKDAPSAEVLRDMILSKAGAPEKFVYKRLQQHEGIEEREPTTTEPLTADEVIQEVKKIGKSVYTLFGFSVLDYEKKRQVMADIRRELEPLDRKTTVINIGATEDGIGAAYEVAKTMGFETIGIVSTQALAYSGKFSPYVDRIFIVNDKRWGGYVEGTKDLTPASRAFLETSDIISAHGGGENTAVILREAVRAGKKVFYSPAEMSHAVANKRAKEKGQPASTDYSGQAFHAWKSCQEAMGELGASPK